MDFLKSAAILFVLLMPASLFAQVDISGVPDFDFESLVGNNIASYDCESIVTASEISSMFGETFTLDSNLSSSAQTGGSCFYKVSSGGFDPNNFDPNNFDPTNLDPSSFIPKSVNFNIFVSDSSSPSDVYVSAEDFYGDLFTNLSDSNVGSMSFESNDSTSFGGVTIEQAAVYFLDSTRTYNVSVVASAPGISLGNVRSLAQLINSKLGGGGLVQINGDIVSEDNTDSIEDNTDNTDSNMDRIDDSNNAQDDNESTEADDPLTGVVDPSSSDTLFERLKNSSPIISWSILGVGLALVVLGFMMFGGGTSSSTAKVAGVSGSNIGGFERTKGGGYRATNQTQKFSNTSSVLGARNNTIGNVQPQTNTSAPTSVPVETNKDLLEYIRKAREAGHKEFSIQSDLLKAGWDSKTIAEHLKK